MKTAVTFATQHALRNILSVATLCTVPVCLSASAQATAIQPATHMSADASPTFAVAAIKPTDPAKAADGWAFPNDGNRVACTGATVAVILQVAYNIHGKQVVGGPEWLSKDPYDITGIASEPGEPDLKQTQHMYQQLLADRFHLAFHRETRSIPIYALTVLKGGPRLQPTKPGEHLNTGSSGSNGQRTLRFTNISMRDFTLNMNLYEDRPVIDQTALPGRYDFTLRWTTDLTHEGEPNAPPSLFTAIKEQLGLRLDAVKGPAEVFVIDHIDRPSEN